MKIRKALNMETILSLLPFRRDWGWVLLLPLLLSCEKEITISYNQVAPLYVAEAELTQNGTKVRISTTQDMHDNLRYSYVVDDAIVVLSWQGEVLDTLQYTSRGLYTSAVEGFEGETYQLDIYIDDQHFQSTSTMQKEPQVNSFRFVWKDIVTERMLFADLRLQDIEGENNYYFMHIYRNKIGYRWAVMRDDTNPGQELQQLFNCTTERNMDNNDADALNDGDQIHVEVRSIDRRTYDYFYSMQVMDNAGTNPIANFTGGCLGYFSAYYVVSFDTVFYRDEVEDE